MNLNFRLYNKDIMIIYSLYKNAIKLLAKMVKFHIMIIEYSKKLYSLYKHCINYIYIQEEYYGRRKYRIN